MCVCVKYLIKHKSCRNTVSRGSRETHVALQSHPGGFAGSSNPVTTFCCNSHDREIVQQRFTQRHVNTNFEWCVVIYPCHRNYVINLCALFEGWYWRNVHLRVMRNLPNVPTTVRTVHITQETNPITVEVVLAPFSFRCACHPFPQIYASSCESPETVSGTSALT